MQVGRDVIYRAIIGGRLIQFPSLQEYFEYLQDEETTGDGE